MIVHPACSQTAHWLYSPVTKKHRRLNMPRIGPYRAVNQFSMLGRHGRWTPHYNSVTVVHRTRTAFNAGSQGYVRLILTYCAGSTEIEAVSVETAPFIPLGCHYGRGQGDPAAAAPSGGAQRSVWSGEACCRSRCGFRRWRPNHPCCGGKMQFRAIIEEARGIERILRHIGAWDPFPPLKAPPDEDD